ncbi:MAG: radical SAM protein [candidate division WOR-3 bacterium]
MNRFDPLKKADEIRSVVVRDRQRKYYRVTRPGKWYGGIATADCCGCNLNCVFCWSNKPRDNPDKIGNFYSAEEVAASLIRCAQKYNYRYVRISGNEPTICKEHLLSVLSIISRTKLIFILETNGTLIDKDFIRELTPFSNLHIRISLKGTTPEEFAMLTGAIPESFNLILDNLNNLVNANLSFNLAVMLSFSPDKNVLLLKERLGRISRRIIADFEEEYVFLYPHVVKRLKENGIRPLIAYTPDGVPRELI